VRCVVVPVVLEQQKKLELHTFRRIVMRCFVSLLNVLSSVVFLILSLVAGAQAPVALPYTMTTIGG